MPGKKRLAIILPTYNEAENLEAIAGRILSVCRTTRVEPTIVVIDDASSDGTGAIAERLKKANPRHFTVVHRTETERGRGTATAAGFKVALQLKPDYLLEMDADFSHDPAYIPHFIHAMSSADIVSGARYIPGGQTVDSPLSRRLISRFTNIYGSLLGLRITDLNSGFRCYTAKAARALDFSAFYSPPAVYYGPEMLVRLAKKGFRIKEIPITFTNRIKGRSKLSLSRLLKSMLFAPRLLQIRFAK